MAESNRDTPLCPCGFWGSVQTAGLCSKCYKEMLMKQECSGRPLQMLTSNTQIVPSTDCGKGQLSQKLSDDINMIFSSNHNNKPQPQQGSTANSGSKDNNDEDFVNMSASVDKDDNDSVYILAQTSTTREMLAAISSSNVVGVTSTPPTATTTTSITTAAMTTTTTSTAVIATAAPVPPSLIVPITTTSVPSLALPPLATVSTSLLDPPSILGGVSNNQETDVEISIKTDASDDNATIITNLTDDTTVATLNVDSVLEKPVQKNKKRCFKCNCKLDLASSTIGRCKCDYIFCDLHRLPEQHDCTFDHKTHGRQDARKKMVSPKKHMGTSLRRLDS